MDWLGFRWNSKAGTLSIIERRIEKRGTLQSITRSGYAISARSLAKCVGQIISTGPVFGNITRIMTRHCSMSTANAETWDDIFVLDSYCEYEL